jgi:hypothetical protein
MTICGRGRVALLLSQIILRVILLMGRPGGG